MGHRKEFNGQVSDADLRILRIFKTVVENGGFSAAEVELNITRAAISIAMSTLETRLGFRLCHRGRSGFSLTEEGMEVYEYTLQLLSALDNFRTQVNALHASLKGALNIGITDNLVSLSHMLVTDAIAQLKEVGPDVAVNIRMVPPNEIERAVLSGQLCVGVVPDIRRLSGLEYTHLYAEKSLLYCAHQHPLFEAQSKGLDAIPASELDTVMPAYAQSAEIKALHQPFKTTASATDREGVAFLILTGKYLGFLPEHYAERWVKEGKMKAVLPDQYCYNTPYAAINSKNIKANLVLKTFLDILCHDQQPE